MLRGAILAGGAALLAAGLVAFALGAFHPAVMFGLCGALVMIGTLYERIRYKPLLKKAPGAGWRKTAERFIDPETGQPVTVYDNPGTGERLYVQE